MLRSPLLTLFPTWHTALLSWPPPQPSFSAPAAPGPGSSCGRTCLGTRSERSAIPLAGIKAHILEQFNDFNCDFSFACPSLPKSLPPKARQDLSSCFSLLPHTDPELSLSISSFRLAEEKHFTLPVIPLALL